jgi:hypothetical protein
VSYGAVSIIVAMAGPSEASITHEEYENNNNILTIELHTVHPNGQLASK